MAEAIFRARAAERGLPATTSSAGLLFDAKPAEPNAVTALERLGVDLSTHRSRVIDEAMIERAGLIVAMEQRHVLEVATLVPGAFARTFTLPDLVQRAEKVGPRSSLTVADWVASLDEPRRRSQILRHNPDAEIPDPMGGTKRAFRRCADSLVDLVDRLIAVAWPEEGLTDQHGRDEPSTPRST
jgi:protein-tyrosine phosphatase